MSSSLLASDVLEADAGAPLVPGLRRSDPGEAGRLLCMAAFSSTAGRSWLAVAAEVGEPFSWSDDKVSGGDSTGAVTAS